MKAKLLTFVRGLKIGTPPRFQSYLKSLALLFALMLGVGNVWGDPIKCISSSDLVAGSVYYISGASSFSASATVMAKSTGGSNFPASTFEQAPVELTLGGDATNGWTFSYVDGTTTYYLDPTSTTSSNHLKRSESITDYGKFAISFGNSGANYNAVITSKGKSSRNTIRINGSIYSCYASTSQSAVYLYKKGTSAPCTVTFNAGTNGSCSTSSLTEESAGAGVTLPSCTANTGYRFVGWATSSEKANAGTADAGAAGATYKPSADITLYAVYVQQFDVTWYINNVPTKKTVDKGSLLTIPDDLETGIDCNGREFLGWTATANYTSADTAPSDLFTVASGTVTENLNFYAVYAAVKQE